MFTAKVHTENLWRNYLDKYKLFIKENVREAYFAHDATYEVACKFLENNTHAMVKDSSGNKFYTKEELKNAKNIRRIDRPGYDNAYTSGGEVHQDSDRELFSSIDGSGGTFDNSESSPDSDN